MLSFTKPEVTHYLIIQGAAFKKISLLKHNTYLFARDQSKQLVLVDSYSDKPEVVVYQEADQWVLSLLNHDASIVSDGGKHAYINLTPDKQVQLMGADIKLLEQTGSASKTGVGQSKPLRAALLSAFLIMVILWGVFGSGRKDSPARPNPSEKPVAAVDGSAAQQTSGQRLPEEISPVVSAQLKGGIEYRLALSYFDAGNMAASLKYLEKSLLKNPDNKIVMRRLLELESAFDRKATLQYQNGCDHARYMRNYEAMAEFRAVLSLLRNENDNRYIDANRMLKELKQPNKRILCKTKE